VLSGLFSTITLAISNIFHERSKSESSSSPAFSSSPSTSSLSISSFPSS
jgi:hypothetical protein